MGGRSNARATASSRRGTGSNLDCIRCEHREARQKADWEAVGVDRQCSNLQHESSTHSSIEVSPPHALSLTLLGRMLIGPAGCAAGRSTRARGVSSARTKHGQGRTCCQVARRAGCGAVTAASFGPGCDLPRDSGARSKPCIGSYLEVPTKPTKRAGQLPFPSVAGTAVRGAPMSAGMILEPPHRAHGRSDSEHDAQPPEQQ